MRTLHAMALIGSATALLASSALAQGKPLPPQPKPARAQQASSGAAIPPAAQQAPVQAARGYDINGQPVLYTTVPVTVGSDGRVWANFGSGFQLVEQECPVQQTARFQNYAAQQQTAPTTGTATQPNTAAGAQTSHSPCWTKRADGQIVAYR
ncbi:MAG TPA: hypothetical protein VIJ16_02575 [Gemmatimonadaceae bacterium]